MGPAALGALARAADESAVLRKVLVGPRRGVCREVLRRLSLERGGWVGFEPMTSHDVAAGLAAGALASRRVGVVDEFGELALIDEAIDEAMNARADVLRPFVEGLGLREAMAHSIRALRHAGIDAAMLGRAGFRDRRKREALVRVLESYERLLYGRSVTDSAGILRQAVSGLEAGAIELPKASYMLLPGQSGRGLAGRLLLLLIERGATVLDDDAVEGLEIPPALLAGRVVHESALSWLHDVDGLPNDAAPGTISIFAAGSVNDEIREVLRRVVASNLPWDQVEIVATDPMTYGAALDTQARRLGIEVSYAAGLPVGRTRPGRAVDAWLRWVRDDFPEPTVRELIDRGDIAAPGGRTSGPALARRLRRLLIGRGHGRYEAALRRAEYALDRPEWSGDDRTQEEIDAACEGDRVVLEDLRAVLDPLLSAVPPLDHRPGQEPPLVAPATLARGLLACLALIPVDDDGGDNDRTARDALRDRLERLAATATRQTTVDGSIALIAAKLDARVPAPAAKGVAPWTAAGGRLHLSDIEHGGWTGRRATFVVGLDAVRFPGATTHDTLLNDEDRRRIVGDASFHPVPTTADRLDERRYALASMLARLRGEVTLSYGAWDATEARTVAPAPEMLQALRLRTRNASADYDSLRKEVGSFACAVPGGAGRLDDADVWFALLARDGVLVTGTDVVREAYAGLDRGLTAIDARGAPEFNAHHGRLRPRPGLDPRGRPGQSVSAKRLETLGTCPHRYMLRYVLGVVPPEEAEFAPDRWLTPMERGRVLHAVYRRSLETARALEQTHESDAFESTVLEALDTEIERVRQRLAPPGDAVFDLERERLRDEAGLFVRMVRRHGAPWVDLERRFGGGPAERTVEIDLPGGVVRASGAIDRIDRESDGRLVVIDYKTGSPGGFGREEAVFHGGRRIQHALYAAAARRLHDDHVARAEYHFPTYRGENQRVTYEEKSLRKARGIVNALLDVVAAGRFYPTDDANDCRFCDYREICRVRDATAIRTDSPLAAWSHSARDHLEELWVLRALRTRRL